MKRNKFIAVLIASATMPAALFSKTKSWISREKKGYKVDAGKDRFNAAITLMEGDTFYTKISNSDTDGGLFAFESTRLVNGGPPLHYHFEQDEWFYILKGEFLFKIGEQTFTAKAGDSLFGPRMIPHAFAKTNEGEAKMLILYQPAGKMEAHFKAVSQGLYKNLTEQEKEKVREEHGFKVVGPALAHEK
jgi:mannose-6-phosphate isomerase-like protein (cupin superfamily)